MLRLCQDSFIFGEATSSHFFRVTSLTQYLLFWSRYFFRASAFLEELSFQNTLLRNSYFFRVANFLIEVPLKCSWSAGIPSCESIIAQSRIIDKVYLISWLREALEPPLFKDRYFFKAVILFRKSYFYQRCCFFRTAHFRLLTSFLSEAFYFVI